MEAIVSVSPPKLIAYGIKSSNDSLQHFKKEYIAHGTASPIINVCYNHMIYVHTS